MNKSPVTYFLACCLLVGSIMGLFAFGLFPFILLVFTGPGNIHPALVGLLIPPLFYLFSSLSVLLRRPWGIHLSCCAGLLGMGTGVYRLLVTGIGQPQLAYLVFFAIHFVWFLSALIKQQKAQQRNPELSPAAAAPDEA